MSDTALFIFRQDLRTLDNLALSNACQNHERVVCVYDDQPKVIEAFQKKGVHVIDANDFLKNNIKDTKASKAKDITLILFLMKSL